jgi:hypothetical protein
VQVVLLVLQVDTPVMGMLSQAVVQQAQALELLAAQVVAVVQVLQIIGEYQAVLQVQHQQKVTQVVAQVVVVQLQLLE